MSPERQREEEPPFPTVATPIDGLRAPIREAKRGYRFAPENLVWPTLLLDSRPDRATTSAPVSIVDLGAGCGVLGLLAAEQVYAGNARLTLVERNAQHAMLCRTNAHCTAADVTVVETDLRQWPTEPRAALVVANPPFFRPGEGQPSRHATTRESTHAHHGGVAAFAQAIARSLSEVEGAEGWLLYPANQLAEAMHAANSATLSVTGLWLLYAAHKGDAPPYRAWLRLSHHAAPLEIHEVRDVG